MPANVTVEYQLAEREYRRANSPAERLRCLEQMLQRLPKHKGSETLQAILKTRIKETRAALTQPTGPRRASDRLRIPRQGAGRIVLIGGPNAGKTRLLAELTNADVTPADWPFSTTTPQPGMLTVAGVPLQLVDTPSIGAGQFARGLNDLIRSADAVVLCIDGGTDDSIEQTLDVIEQLHTHRIALSNRTGLADDDFTIVELATLCVVQRAGTTEWQTRLDLLDEAWPDRPSTITIDWNDAANRSRLEEALLGLLDVVRVFTRRPGEKHHDETPITVPNGATLEDLAREIHADLPRQFESARVWRENTLVSARAGLEFSLEDGDLVEIHKR